MRAELQNHSQTESILAQSPNLETFIALMAKALDYDEKLTAKKGVRKGKLADGLIETLIKIYYRAHPVTTDEVQMLRLLPETSSLPSESPTEKKKKKRKKSHRHNAEKLIKKNHHSQKEKAKKKNKHRKKKARAS